MLGRLQDTEIAAETLAAGPAANTVAAGTAVAISAGWGPSIGWWLLILGTLVHME